MNAYKLLLISKILPMFSAISPFCLIILMHHRTGRRAHKLSLDSERWKISKTFFRLCV